MKPRLQVKQRDSAVTQVNEPNTVQPATNDKGARLAPVETMQPIKVPVKKQSTVVQP